MDIQRLRIFLAVAREGSISRAGEKVHLSQPAISLQIKQLQSELGMVLFEREPQGMRLSPDGVAMLPWAERVVSAMSEFTQYAQRLHNELRGQLAIGTILDPEFTRLGPFLKALVGRAPQVQTVLRHGISGQGRQLISNGDLDVAFFLGNPNTLEPAGLSPRWHCHVLSSFRYRVLAPAGWGARVL
jgi:DNA-binding transcriptional LysR family regulator